MWMSNTLSSLKISGADIELMEKKLTAKLSSSSDVKTNPKKVDESVSLSSFCSYKSCFQATTSPMSSMDSSVNQVSPILEDEENENESDEEEDEGEQDEPCCSTQSASSTSKSSVFRVRTRSCTRTDHSDS